MKRPVERVFEETLSELETELLFAEWANIDWRRELSEGFFTRDVGRVPHISFRRQTPSVPQLIKDAIKTAWYKILFGRYRQN